jgi:YD repeat-containing protein
MRHRGYRALWLPALCALASAASASETVAYSYDALGRLTATTTTGSVNNGAGSAIAYDPAGNRTAYSVTGAAGAAPPGAPGPLGARPAGAEPAAAAVEPAGSEAAQCEPALAAEPQTDAGSDSGADAPPAAPCG